MFRTSLGTGAEAVRQTAGPSAAAHADACAFARDDRIGVWWMSGLKPGPISEAKANAGILRVLLRMTSENEIQGSFAALRMTAKDKRRSLRG